MSRDCNCLELMLPSSTNNRTVCLLIVLSVKYNFWPRDAMHKRGLCRPAVSDCLSVTFLYCVETAKDMVIVAIVAMDGQ